MAGASIDAIGVINQIKGNLNDRYDNGFDVLKEIIQNSDDAGASSLKIGWCHGFDNTDNELLNAPAIFFINNAPLEEAHKDAILSIAQSSKAASKSSVGKFGLGMKSLFHLGEAFFFQSNEWRDKDWAAEVFNPWDRHRKNWNLFSDKDKSQIQKRLDNLLNSYNKEWFIVWVPLRTQALVDAYNNEMIIGTVSDGKTLPEFFNEDDLAEHTAEILPQLKHLTEVSFYKSTNSHSYDLLTEVQLQNNSQRSAFIGEPILSNKEKSSVFSGTISSKILGQSDTANKLEFLGYETILSNPSLAKLKTEEMGWPKSYQLDKATDRPIEALDKAEQHVAVTVSRVPKTSKNAYLKANWAVFLPLKDTDELTKVAIKGDYNYNFYLHGYFFVDAGRKGLQGHSQLGQSVTLDNVKNNEKRLREVWNVLLASDGTFNYVLQAFSEFCQKYKLNTDVIETITAALNTMFVRASYLKEVTKNYHWLYQVSKGEQAWSLLPSNKYCLPIPKPSANDYSRVWATLPKLTRLGDNYCLYEKKGVEFVSTKHNETNWNSSLLKEVLQVDPLKIFEASINVEYLFEFIRTVIETPFIEGINETLLSVYVGILDKVGLSQLSKSKKLSTELFGLLNGRFRVDVPIDQDNFAVWGLIRNISSDKLLVPRFLKHGEKISKGLLNETELVAMLTKLDGYIRRCTVQDNKEEFDQKGCDRLIRFVIESAKNNNDINLSRFYQKCASLKLIEIENVNGKPRKQYFSSNELKDALQNNQLFTRSDDGKYGLGEILKDVIPNTDLLYISKANVTLAFESEVIKPCSSSACLILLSTYPELSNEQARIDLIKRLVDDFVTDEEKRGFRYLIHGSKQDSLDITLWKSAKTTSEVWMKIWLLCQPKNSPSWVTISSNISNNLTYSQEMFLNVEEQTYLNIIKQFELKLPEIEYQSFTEAEINELLSDIGRENLAELWKALPVHNSLEGQRVAISDNCLMKGDVDLPKDWSFTLIEYSPIGDISQMQKRWIKQGLPTELLEIALLQEKFTHHSEFILSLLTAVYKGSYDINEELHTKITETKWLQLQAGKLVSPSQIVDINSTHLPCSHKLCSNDVTEFFLVDQLQQNLISTLDAKQTVKKIIKKSKFLIGTNLLSAASQVDKYALGEIKKIDEKLVIQFSNLPKIMPYFPGWQLVYELYSCDYLKLDSNKQQMLAKPLDAKSIKFVLEMLASDNTVDSSLVRLALLEALCNAADGRKLLLDINLKNIAGKYVNSRSLVHNVGQVANDYLIDPNEFAVIESFCKQSLSNLSSNSIVGNVKINSSSNRKVLEEYFSAWEGRVSHDLIAMFLVIFSGDIEIEKLCKGYLKNTTIDSLIEEYNNKYKSYVTERGPFSGMPFRTLINSIKFEVMSSSENMSYMNSIFGERIQVSLSANVNSILVHQKSSSNVKRIELREINPGNTEKDKLLKLLVSGIEVIFADIFGHIIRFEADLKKKFGSSEQMDIQVTNRLILEQLVPMLERLRVNLDGLDDLVREYRLENRALTMSDSSHQNKTKLNAILEKIQSKVLGSPKIKNAILAAVRNEVGSNFQYSASSALFELYQNADDAMSELIKMNAEQNTINCFDVRLNNSQLHIYHWGRELNYCRSNYEPGRGHFDRDLEKMVSLNISDKAEGSTGKFGLGFKSTLLVTDTPEIVSGDICTEIEAGIFPSIPKPNIVKELNELASAAAIDNKMPTLIRLKASPQLNVDLPGILSEFEENAGLLTVFSRHIKTINIGDQSFSWIPKQLSQIPEISIGMVKLPQAGNEEAVSKLVNQRVLCITTKTGQFIFSISKQGFMSLAKRPSINSFWVLNPLGEALKLGFIINAPFNVDIGRSQLANDNKQNELVVEKLGRELADVFSSLYEWSINEWNELTDTLELDNGLSPYKLWESIWKVLTDNWPARVSEKNSRAQLLRRMFQTPDGLLDFYGNKNAVPCKLVTNEPRLVNLSRVKYGADSFITASFADLKDHNKLSKFVDNNALISHDEFKTLKQIEGKDFTKNVISLDQLLEKDFFDNRATLRQASFWGKYFISSFDNQSAGLTGNVQVRVKNILASLRFENGSKSFFPTDSILNVQSKDIDEQLLATFAPEYYLLNEGYDDVSRAFMTKYRQHGLKFSAEKIFDWITSSQVKQSNKNKCNACYYIANGNLGTKVAEIALLKGQSTWLFAINELTLKQWNWSDEDIAQFLLNMTPPETKKAVIDAKAKEQSRQQQDIEVALDHIYDWWQVASEKQLSKYEKRLYPDGYFDWTSIKEDSHQERFNLAWLKLLFLGSCQTFGQRREEQHRGALSYFENKDWWQIFANPKEHGKWFGVMDEFFEKTVNPDEYRAWLQILPLYRFSKNLDDYIELFISADAGLSSINALTQPNSAPELAGSGINVPELKATLGIGANFILRELYRHGVYSNDNLKAHCFVTTQGVKDLISEKLSGSIYFSNVRAENSNTLFKFLCRYLGENKATFNGAFDIPLRILSRDLPLLDRVLKGDYE